MPVATIQRPVPGVVLDMKPPVAILDPQPPASPELKALLSDVQDKMKLSFAMAAAGVTPAQPTPVDQLFRAMIASRRPAVQSKVRAHAQTVLSAPAAVRQITFGRYGAIDRASYRGADHAQATLGVPKVDGPRLAKALDAFGRNDANLVEVSPDVLKQIDLGMLRKLKPTDPDLVAGLKYKKLGLFLKSVHCYHETWELSDSDEIAMGGTATSPNGTTFKIPEFMVSDDFDAGETKTYSGKGRLLHEWNIFTSHDWPHVYAAVICMSEKDGSGFTDFLNQLWEKVGDQVKQAIAGAVGGAIGAALGSFFGPLGTAIGTAIGWLLGALIGWILSWFEDDIVACHTILLTLGAATKSYYDWAHLTDSPPKQFHINYNGDGGGQYRCWFSLSVYP